MNTTTTSTNHNFLMTTAAPVAVHQCEVISVIAEELLACFHLGFGMTMSVLTETTKPCDDATTAPINEALSRMDIDWSNVGPDRDLGLFVDSPTTVDTIAAAALASVKVWASDVNAFYNNDLLQQMVSKLCDDYFQIGLMTRHDTFTAMYTDVCIGMDEAIKACGQIERSAS